MKKCNMKLLFLAITIAGIVYVLDEKFNQAPILETGSKNPLGKPKKKRKTYDEFVALAKVDHKQVMGVPWVQRDLVAPERL